MCVANARRVLVSSTGASVARTIHRIMPAYRRVASVESEQAVDLVGGFLVRRLGVAGWEQPGDGGEQLLARTGRNRPVRLDHSIFERLRVVAPSLAQQIAEQPIAEHSPAQGDSKLLSHQSCDRFESSVTSWSSKIMYVATFASARRTLGRSSRKD